MVCFNKRAKYIVHRAWSGVTRSYDCIKGACLDIQGHVQRLTNMYPNQLSLKFENDLIYTTMRIHK